MVISIFVLLLFSGCAVPSGTMKPPATGTANIATSTELSPTQSAIQEPKQSLTICTSSLPDTLFIYDGNQSVVKDNLLAIMFDPPFEKLGGDLIPAILKKIPAQLDGDLRLVSVPVQRGQTVVDFRGDLVVMTSGVKVRPSGCRTSDCAIVWDGEESLNMDQMVMDYHLRDDLTWSDGTSLTALDTLFSFKLANAAEVGGLKWATERTAAYAATGEFTVQWIGKPGFTTADIERFFWTPLPSHLFNGSETWEDLVGAAGLAVFPLSYGPYVLSARDPNSIIFEVNPYYYRLEEDLPGFDEIVFKVVAEGPDAAWEQMKSGGCDILDDSFGLKTNEELLLEIQADQVYSILTQPGESWTQLVFGIQPASYDDYYNYHYGGRPDFFGDIRTRQAIAMSLDRRALLDAAAGGFGAVWTSFLSSSRSQLDDQNLITYDPDLSAELLFQVGWRDHDENPETPLQAWEVYNIPAGMPFSVELLISQSGFHQALAELIRHSLQEIGIGVTVTSLPAETLYHPGPEGLLFGRQFDLTILSWQPMLGLDCGYYQSWQIPTMENRWIGTNITGLANDDYDRACATAILALPEERSAASLQAEQYFVKVLPAVPLVAPTRLCVISEKFISLAQNRGCLTFFEDIEYMGD